MEYGLYLHIPYCKSRCRYCDFYSQPASRSVPDAYVEALLRDFACHAPRQGSAPARPATVYFGGGTPGLLSAAQVERILNRVQPLPGAEITLEANPDGLTEQTLAAWRSAGVNRLSLGVQSFRDSSLRTLGRLHSAEDNRRALAAAHRAGFTNLSADVLLALPGYSTAEWDETLAALVAAEVAHVSAYLLKIEPSTAFGRNLPPLLPEADAAADFYLYAAHSLQAAGYARYEISNFAREGFASRHNLLYWQAGSWLGLGPAAHSCLSGRRFSFAPDVAAFLGDTLAPQEEGTLDAEDYIMLRLRLAEGLSEAQLRQRYAAALTPRQHQVLRRLCQNGHAQKTAEGYRLSSEGLLVQNSILAQLFA